MPNADEFPDILKDVMDGKRPLPNFQNLHFERAIAVIAGGPSLVAEPEVRWAVIQDTPTTLTPCRPARYFLRKTQSGGISGDGYVMIADAKGPRLGSFKICGHEKVLGRDAAPQKGWYPGKCKFCGLDLSVDSS